MIVVTTSSPAPLMAPRNNPPSPASSPGFIFASIAEQTSGVAISRMIAVTTPTTMPRTCRLRSRGDAGRAYWTAGLAGCWGTGLGAGGGIGASDIVGIIPRAIPASSARAERLADVAGASEGVVCRAPARVSASDGRNAETRG